MKIGFDLDGTLDRPALGELCKTLLAAGHEVHIITGVFPEAQDWQDTPAKIRKLQRIDIPFRKHMVASDLGTLEAVYGQAPYATLHVLYAVPSTFDRDYRLADLGLRKGALCEELGLQMFFDDSATYCKMIPKMAGNVVILKVGMEDMS
jgi:hypothetical protein